MTTRILELPEVDLAHEVHGPLPPTEGSRALVMIGQPMTADGFRALASHFGDRTVVLYDPRGLGRSATRRDGRDDQTPVDQAADLHALVESLGVGPVDVFVSSGGAVAGLELAALRRGSTRVVVGVGEEGGETLTARCARALAAELGSEAVVFPGGHGGFGGEDDPYPGRATDFAVRLRQVLEA